MLVFGAAWVGAQEAPKAVDLGLSVQWGDVDIAPEVDIPEGWRMPTLAEIKELRENCTQSALDKDGEEWVVFTGKNGNSVCFLYPIGSRSAREFGIAGSDGCYLKVIILNRWLLHLGVTGRDQPGPKKVPCTFSQRIAL